MQLLRRDVFGLKFQISARPRARHHDRRAHCAQFRCEPFGVFGRVCFAVFFAFGTGAPDNRVMRAGSTGHMQFLYQRMFCQIGTGRAVAFDDAHKVAVDQWLQGDVQIVGEVVVDRVHLQNDDLIFQKQLLEHIQRRD